MILRLLQAVMQFVESLSQYDVIPAFLQDILGAKVLYDIDVSKLWAIFCHIYTWWGNFSSLLF